jgi:hypothetical protein
MKWWIDWVDFVEIKFHLNKNIEWYYMQLELNWTLNSIQIVVNLIEFGFNWIKVRCTSYWKYVQYPTRKRHLSTPFKTNSKPKYFGRMKQLVKPKLDHPCDHHHRKISNFTLAIIIIIYEISTSSKIEVFYKHLYCFYCFEPLAKWKILQHFFWFLFLWTSSKMKKFTTFFLFYCFEPLAKWKNLQHFFCFYCFWTSSKMKKFTTFFLFLLLWTSSKMIFSTIFFFVFIALNL